MVYITIKVCCEGFRYHGPRRVGKFRAPRDDRSKRPLRGSADSASGVGRGGFRHGQRRVGKLRIVWQRGG
jgi:hypothetical protein